MFNVLPVTLPKQECIPTRFADSQSVCVWGGGESKQCV